LNLGWQASQVVFRGGNMSGESVVVTQIVVTKGKMKNLVVTVDGKRVEIPVSAELMAFFVEQFKRNTTDQQKRYVTLMNLVRLAYLKGLSDGKGK
jgi:hypothetical protein